MHLPRRPGRSPRPLRRPAPTVARRAVAHRVWFGAAALAVLAMAACSVPAAPAPAPTPPTTLAATFDRIDVMGASRVTVNQMLAWFDSRTAHRSGYAATEPVDTLAQRYFDEGAAEGVAGDVAFVQGILETGWFRFTGSSVPPSYNNFAGIGATDVNPAPAQFATPQDGVRAQIQHLRAYADATATTCTEPPLHRPCVDPRFALVSPKGKAPTWNQFGNGNWATDPTYASKIWNLYSSMLSYDHVPLP